MSYLGNLQGPRESDLMEELGHEFFGIGAAQLAGDVGHHRYAESRGEVVRVHLDEDGDPFIVFSRRRKPQRFYLKDKHALRGQYRTFSAEETARSKAI